MNRTHLITGALVLLYLLLRLASSPPTEAVLSTAVFMLSLLVVLRVAGGGSWTKAIGWFGDHRLTSIVLLVAVIAVASLAVVKANRSAPQIIGDVLMAAGFFWAFGAVASRFQSKWLS